MQLYNNSQFHFGVDETVIPCIKRYLKDTEYEVASSVFYKDGRGASNRLATLMGEKVFDFPKDEFIFEDFIKLVSTDNKDDIILDFFSGSATTAHAVMQLNAEDGGYRKFIMVQLPEKQTKRVRHIRQDIRTSAKSARSASVVQERKSRKKMPTRRA